MANKIALTVDGAPMLDQNGREVYADVKTFKTGSTGFYAGGKVLINGKRHQLTMSVVLIGSKPKLATATEPLNADAPEATE